VTAILVYDGDCGFCTTCVGFIDRHLHTSATIAAWQHIELGPLGLTTKQVHDKLQWVAADGTVSSGHAAIGRLLVDSGGWWRIPGRIALTRRSAGSPPASTG
jgi:predicted DCC family thiol-disulfide oxidoreductase YuxK